MKCIALPLNLYNVYTIQVISTDSKNTLWQICIHAYTIDILIACWWYILVHIYHSEDKKKSHIHILNNFYIFLTYMVADVSKDLCNEVMIVS